MRLNLKEEAGRKGNASFLSPPRSQSVRYLSTNNRDLASVAAQCDLLQSPTS